MVLSIIQMPLPPSAADWTRFQKLRQFNNPNPKAYLKSVVTPPGCAPCSSRAGIRRDQDAVAGSSKIRETASSHTDQIAWGKTDFVTRREQAGSKNPEQIRTQLCASSLPCVSSVLRTNSGILRSAVYQHSRIL